MISMKKIYWKWTLVMLPFFMLLNIGSALGWNDKTHMSVSQSAGYEAWYNSAGPDVAKIKAGDIEATNHWFNNNAGIDVTDQMVLDQAVRYNLPDDKEGHLYGAIVTSLRDYLKAKGTGKYAEYNMAFCAHYIGDLSMPFHNYLLNDFSKAHHSKNDATVEFGVMNNIGLIQKNMVELTIKNEQNLAREVSKIANMSRQLAIKLEKENRDMTSEEAYSRLSQSAPF